jgi:hypothetical protein
MEHLTWLNAYSVNGHLTRHMVSTIEKPLRRNGNPFALLQLFRDCRDRPIPFNISRIVQTTTIH